MSKRRKPPATTRVDTTSSNTALAQQLDNRHEELTALHTRIAAYQARLGVRPGTPKRPHANDPDAPLQQLLERLAGALQLASIAELAITSPTLDGHSGDLRDVGRPMPGQATAQPRQRARELRAAIVEAMDRFDWASENNWQRKPHPRAGIPKVRCASRECPAYGIWDDAWKVIRGGRTIYRERCASCGNPYPRSDENGNAA